MKRAALRRARQTATQDAFAVGVATLRAIHVGEIDVRGNGRRFQANRRLQFFLRRAASPRSARKRAEIHTRLGAIGVVALRLDELARPHARNATCCSALNCCGGTSASMRAASMRMRSARVGQQRLGQTQPRLRAETARRTAARRSERAHSNRAARR